MHTLAQIAFWYVGFALTGSILFGVWGWIKMERNYE